jgi:Mrp family chromosome partitioning ATPase/predicted Fe-Mo cluster-binding NifX family protein
MSTEKQSCSASHDDKQAAHAAQDLEIKERLNHIKNKILVMSGKGGVGKSSIAAYLSFILAKRGRKVGLMDVDLHGPSIPRLLGITGDIQLSYHSGKVFPVDVMPNLNVISIEALMGENKDAATIWRGPLKIGVIRQFISDIEWAELDYLIIDSPPGTGDEPLTVAQTVPDARAIIVTTPQEISLADARKSIDFCRKVNMEILGIVENMSGLKCPHCGKSIDLFKTEGGRLTARKEGLRLLASLPIEPEFVKRGDMGDLLYVFDECLEFTGEFNRLVDQVEEISIKEIPLRAQKLDEIKETEEPLTGNKIIIALPTAEGKLCSHFGHCEQFVLVETEDGVIKGKTLHTPPPHEPGLLPRWLHEKGASVVIAGGMGESAQQIFRQNGIRVITGAPMDSPESLVNQYLSNTLVTGSNICDH